MIRIDLDFYLREECFLDRGCRLSGEFADKTPEMVGDGRPPIQKGEKSHNHDWGSHPDERHMEEIAEDRIPFASDYPYFDSEYPNTVPDLNARTDITAKQKEMLLGTNAEALLGWSS